MKHAPPPKPIRSPDTYPLHGKDIESQGELHKEEVEVEVEVDTAFYNSEGDFNQIRAFIVFVSKLVNISSPNLSPTYFSA